MASVSVPLRALLAASLDARELRQAAERLDVGDLRALGSFAAQPHPLVQRAVAVALALLLSLAPVHDDAEGAMLHVRPWAVLRLELLTDSVALWGKLHARVRQLETGNRVLSPVQVRFACQELLRFLVIESYGQEGRAEMVMTLDPVARVSTIAAALSAWSCLCLFHACAAPMVAQGSASPIKIVLSALENEECSREQHYPAEIALSFPLHEQKTAMQSWKIAPRLDLLPDRSYPTQLQGDTDLNARISRRFAFKVGGRYVLFHTRVFSQPDSVVCSMLVLDTSQSHCGRQRDVWPLQRLEHALWLPFQPLELESPWDDAAARDGYRRVCLSGLPRTALDCVLIQLATQAGIFQLANAGLTRPRLPVGGDAMRWSLMLQSFLIALSSSSPAGTHLMHCQWSIMSVGRIVFPMDTPVEVLRSKIVAALAKEGSLYRSRSEEDRYSWDSFQFVHQGKILAREQEQITPAAALLPIMMLLLPTNPTRSHQTADGLNMSIPFRLQRDISTQLLNCDAPRYIERYSTELTAEVIPIRQPVCSYSSRNQSTAAIVAEMLRNWEAFVQLQHLQDDSSVVYQLSPGKKRAKKAVMPKWWSLEAFLASHGSDENCKPKDPTPQLPRKRFNPKKEFMLPLYAIAHVTSESALLLSSPYIQHVFENVKPGVRLALMDDIHVVHVRDLNANVQRGSSLPRKVQPMGAAPEQSIDLEHHVHTPEGHSVEISFERDGRCPVENLQHLRGAYVWCIAPRSRTVGSGHFAGSDTHSGKQKHDSKHDRKWPPRWLCAIYRYITHPVVESSFTRSFHRFQVGIKERYVERAVEATFWSRDVDWEVYLRSADIQAVLLRRCYELLCHSHPPSSAVDGVKFSKLLRECGVQPQFLTVGDAAYLFASHLSPGSHYEMAFDGFERALDCVAHTIYGRQQTDTQLSPLRQFCFDRLVNAPSLLLIWRDVVNEWRLTEKHKRMQAFADEYCAATRIRALWKQVTTRRVHIQTLERMKAERHAATKIQSALRMRVMRRSFTHLRHTAERVQSRIKARSELRRRRRERAALAEWMRVRIVRWMRSRLRVLRAWKQLNERWIARRDRIWHKRHRMVAVVAVHFETRCYRLYMYQSESVFAASETGKQGATEINDAVLFELEIIDSQCSSCAVVLLTRTQVATFSAEERSRLCSPSSFFSSGQQEAFVSRLNELDDRVFGLPVTVASDSLLAARPGRRSRRARPRPNAVLETIARRIRLPAKTTGVQFYSNPMNTSLGKRLFFGAVRCDLQDTDARESGGSRYCVVKLLQRADALTISVFRPSTTTSQRFDVTAGFLFRLLQCMQHRGLRLPPSTMTNPRLDQADALLEVVQILRSPWRLQALRSITSYLAAYGTEEPNHSMSPQARAAKHLEQQEERRRVLAEAHARMIARVIRVQLRARQLLARRKRLQLALTRYRRQFDRRRGRFVYVLEGSDVARYDSKPSSLFDKDVPLPPDAWEPVVELATRRVLHYENRYRDLCSRFDDDQAARCIQRWFRRLVWLAIKPWGLRQLVAALQFHRATARPSQLEVGVLTNDPRALESAKRHALQLHALDHDYKSAFAMYETVLKAAPTDAETLACLAVLLAASCRYPTTQTWARATQLLQEAAAALTAADGSSLQDALVVVEDACFCWALLLNPQDPEAIVNYAVFVQCVRREMDKAERLYRRGLGLDPMNARLVENYRRLRAHRTPGGLYASAGPGRIAVSRAQELSRRGRWREMEDPAAFTAEARRFFVCRESGECVWTLPDVEADATAGVEAAADSAAGADAS